MRKKFVRENKYAILLTVAVAILVIGTIAVNAGLSMRQMIANRAGDKLAATLTEEIANEVVEETFKAGAFPGPDVYNEVRVHDTLKSSTAFIMPLNFRTPTTSGGVADPDVGTLIGSRYIPNDMICDAAWLDSATTTVPTGIANVVGWATVSVGTSTSATSSNAGLITIAELPTTTNNIFSKEDDEGSFTDDVWLVNAGEHFVAWTTFDSAAGAGGEELASSTAITSGDSNTKGGNVYFNCYYR